MASMTITIPDAALQRVLAGLSPSDPTAAAAKQVVVAWIKRTVAAYEAEQARALANAGGDIDVT